MFKELGYDDEQQQEYIAKEKARIRPTNQKHDPSKRNAEVRGTITDYDKAMSLASKNAKTQDIAGQAALTLAIRYVKQKQPKMAYKFYRKSIQKERIENKELLEESLELKVASKRWRGLKERREGEEAIVEK